MRHRWLLALVLLGLGAVSLSAQAAPNPASNAAQQRDGAVLETVLLDMYMGPNAVVVPRKRVEPLGIYFNPEASRSKLEVKEILTRREPMKWEKLSPAEIQLVQEAAENQVVRWQKDDFVKPFTPKDKRVVSYTKEREEQHRNLLPFERPVRVHFHTPGYSKDGRVAIIRVSWVDFHDSDATYVLVNRNDRWSILVRDFWFPL